MFLKSRPNQTNKQLANRPQTKSIEDGWQWITKSWNHHRKGTGLFIKTTQQTTRFEMGSRWHCGLSTGLRRIRRLRVRAQVALVLAILKCTTSPAVDGLATITFSSAGVLRQLNKYAHFKKYQATTNISNISWYPYFVNNDGTSSRFRYTRML